MPSVSSAPSANESRVRAAVMQAAGKTGVDFNYLYNQARIESALNPQAKAGTSSAAGLYQFTKQTWLQIVKAHGSEHGAAWAANAIVPGTPGLKVGDPTLTDAIDKLRYDPEFSSAMAASFASDNRDQLEDGLGRTVELVDLYLAHFLGPAGAREFLGAYDSDPDAAAAPLFPAAARANASVFYDKTGAPKSLRDIRDSFAQRIDAPVDASLPAVQRAWRSTVSRHVVNDRPERPPLQMLGIEAMPDGPSLEIATRAYQRLAGMGS